MSHLRQTLLLKTVPCIPSIHFSSDFDTQNYTLHSYWSYVSMIAKSVPSTSVIWTQEALKTLQNSKNERTWLGIRNITYRIILSMLQYIAVHHKWTLFKTWEEMCDYERNLKVCNNVKKFIKYINKLYNFPSLSIFLS